jgi:nucleoside-diphosphate-sugar epimerase
VAELSLDGYCAANARITDTMRRTIARLRPAGLFLSSSGAVYRADRSIDTDLAANPYGVLKHRDETIFAGACGAAGTKLVTARVFNLAGEYINKLGSYALSSFILDALAGRPITVRATRLVERSYVYVGDVIALAVACLLDGQPAPPVFDTVGERVVEVGELAILVQEKCGQPEVSIQRPPLDAALPADRYVGDFGAMRQALGLRQLALKRLSQQIEATARFLRRASAAQGAGPRQVA